METQVTSTEEVLRTLLERTAVLQARDEVIMDALLELRTGQTRIEDMVGIMREEQAEFRTRTAVMQANIEMLVESNKAILAAVGGLRDGQAALGISVSVLQTELVNVKQNYATEAQVESVRSELYKALNRQTLGLFVGVSAVCSALAYAVYYIVRF